MLRSAARTLVDALPAKHALVRAGALLPPGLRSRAGQRLFAALAARSDPGMEVVTNLGMDARFRCKVPASSTVAAFGKASLYEGERGALALAQWMCRGADAFVDVGAHLGYFTFYLRSAGLGIPVYGFEPDPELFERLAANVQANRLEGIHLQRAGMSDAVGRSVFYRNLSDPNSGSLTRMFAGRHELREIEVETTTFAQLAAQRGLQRACVKVDVEGAEHLFLAGAQPALRAIDSLIVEVLGPAIESGFVRELIALGLHAYYVNDYRLEFSTDGRYSYQPPQFNWLFCREAPEALAQRLAGSPLQVTGG